jgi:hypothetical protein
MNINTIINQNGDILGDNAIKNVINYQQNEQSSDVIKSLTLLLNEIQKSDLENKDTLIENIKLKTNNPLELRDYLGDLANIATIAPSVNSVLSSLLL